MALFLVAKNRLGILPDLITEYGYLIDAHYGKVHAEITTAVPLSEEEKGRLQERLTAITGKEVVVTAGVNPEIMGGLVARVGDKLIDGSVQTKLKELRRSLIEPGG